MSRRLYIAVDRRDALGPAFDVLLGVVDAVLPIELPDVQRARNVLGAPSLQARDAIHVAIMQRHDIDAFSVSTAPSIASLA